MQRLFWFMLSLWMTVVTASTLAQPSTPIMRVREIRPGMKGYGLTVFRGTKIERFEIEVLGVLPKANFGRDLIFIKMTGGPLNTRGVNIAAGMSGSPIYINGRLAGAVSMTFWGFPKEPQCLVTPIEDMLEALDPRLPKEPAGMARAQAEPQTVIFGGKRIVVAPDNAPPAGAGELVFTRPPVPVMASGLSARSIQRLNALLQPYNMFVMPAAGRAADMARQVPPLQPGSAVGVALATGDVDLSAIGTVTYRDGNRVLIFGHPFMGIGAIDAPLTTAYVFDVVPSYSRSVKIAAPVSVVGRTTQDRLFSVAGELGKRPAMVPVTVDVEDIPAGRKRRFQAQVVQHPLLTGQLVSLVAYETLSQIRGTPGDSLARVQLKVDADEVGTITRDNMVFDDVDIASSATSELDNLMNILTANPFYPLAVKSVDLRVRIESRRQTATVERVFVRKGRYEPGETVQVGVVLKPYRSQPVTREVSLTLPQSLRSGRYTLQVRGGAQSSLVVMPGLVIRTGTPEQAPPTSVQQMVNRFLERERNNDLVVRLLLPTSTVNIGGERFSQMPPTMGALMRSGKSSALRLERDEMKLVLPTEWVLSGSQMLVLNVQRRDSSETRPVEPRLPSGEPMPPDTAPPGIPGGVPASLESYLPDEEVQAFAESVTLSQPRETRARPAQTGAGASAAQPGGAQPPREPSEREEKPVARTAQVWTQTEQADFAKGFFDRTTATSEGDVRLSLTLARAVDTGKPFVWTLVPEGDGSLLIGTGHEGDILRLSSDGKLSSLCRLPELEVHWLVADAQGWLAGTSPRGRIYRVTADGQCQPVAQLEQSYPVCAVRRSGDSVLIGAGGGAGVVYEWRDGQASALLQTGQNHVTALAIARDGTVYAGTGDNATLWRILPDNSAQAIRDFGEGAISALAVWQDGSVLVALQNRPQLLRLYPDGRIRTVIERTENPVLALIPAPEDSMFAIGSGFVYQIFPDNRVNLVENRLDVDFAAGVWWHNALWLGTVNGGEIYTARLDGGEGAYTSPVHDARSRAQWGALYWIAETPEGTSIEISTRSGNVPEPDASWSEWSSALTNPGDVPTSPPARYVQYRAVLRTRNSQVTPRLQSVSLYYRTQNQPPRVTLKSPRGGAVLSGEQSIEWQAEDPDKDTLTYRVYYRLEGEREWQEIQTQAKSSSTSSPRPSEQKPARQQPSSGEDVPSVAEMMADLRRQVESDPTIPAEVKAEILANAERELPQVRAAMQQQTQAETRAERAAEPAPPAPPTSATSRKWDTKSLKDGVYRLRVVASDRPSNATDALSAEAVSEPVIVCNSKPVIVVSSREGVQVDAEGAVQVSGFVLQKLVPVTAVQVRINEGDWLAAEAGDGVFDSSLETFRFRSDKLPKGEHQVTVKAFNAAGLSTTWQKKVRIGQ
ncbi:MAG: SpoIVB peptidase S55 domain-containing protein [Armatimonadota bacterium]|nr:SpoIVB peptidase S55 domain-containing protein [Armatimonadota bacterium]